MLCHPDSKLCDMMFECNLSNRWTLQTFISSSDAFGECTPRCPSLYQTPQWPAQGTSNKLIGLDNRTCSHHLEHSATMDIQQSFHHHSCSISLHPHNTLYTIHSVFSFCLHHTPSSQSLASGTLCLASHFKKSHLTSLAPPTPRRQSTHLEASGPNPAAPLALLHPRVAIVEKKAQIHGIHWNTLTFWAISSNSWSHFMNIYEHYMNWCLESKWPQPFDWASKTIFNATPLNTFWLIQSSDPIGTFVYP